MGAWGVGPYANDTAMMVTTRFAAAASDEVVAVLRGGVRDAQRAALELVATLPGWPTRVIVAAWDAYRDLAHDAAWLDTWGSDRDYVADHLAGLGDRLPAEPAVTTANDRS